MRFFIILTFLLLNLYSDVISKVVDLPTRHNISQRLLVLSPYMPKAVVVLFAGGHGGLQISIDGKFGWGTNNFLIRTRELFVDKDLMVVIVDAPSDKQSGLYLHNFRQTEEHAKDITHIVEWISTQTAAPIWLIGTSRGVESVAYAAIKLSELEHVHGFIFTSTILADTKSQSVIEMDIERIVKPVLVVHHKNDECLHCSFSLIPSLMNKLKTFSKELYAVEGGQTYGDPCNAFGYHGFNGLEKEVVGKISKWVISH